MLEQFVYPILIISLSIFIIYKTEYFKKLGQNRADKETSKDIAFEKQLGENLATKKDIEEITTKVESIKTEFIRETEKLKIEMQFDNHFKMSFNNQIRESVLNVYDSYFIWQNKIVSIQSNGNDLDEKTILDIINEMSVVYFNFYGSKARVELYIQDEELQIVLKEILTVSIKLHLKIQERLNEILPFLLHKKILGMDDLAKDPIEFYKKLGNSIEELNSYVANVTKQISDAKEKLHKENKKHNDEITGYINELVKHTPKFREVCYRLIKTIRD